MLDEARQLLGQSSIHLPSKVVVAPSIDSLEHRICSIESVQDHEMILDQCVDRKCQANYLEWSYWSL